MSSHPYYKSITNKPIQTDR